MFVGVEYDFYQRVARRVHVSVAREDDPVARELVNWSYRGLVYGGVLGV